MNGAEQRRQRTVSERLEQTSESLAVLLDALDARMFEEARKAQDTRRELNELKVKHEQQVRRVDFLWVEHDTTVHYTNFFYRPFWQRLSWLVRGR